jgi:hypothetical protein
MQTGFGAGALFAERVDVTGTGIGPMQFGIVQSVSIDFDFTTKPLYGQNQFPVAVARSNGRITGKTSFARINGVLWADLLFGNTMSAGKVSIAYQEAATVPAISPYTVTVANSATFANDLGVIDNATGNLFTRVTTPTAALEYSVNKTTGVYTFSAAATGKAVVVSYEYSTAASGKTTILTNQLMGKTPTFRMVFNQQISPGAACAGQQVLPLTVILNCCTSNKLSLPTRVDDWMIEEFDFEAYADAAGIIGKICTDE